MSFLNVRWLSPLMIGLLFWASLGSAAVEMRTHLGALLAEPTRFNSGLSNGLKVHYLIPFGIDGLLSLPETSYLLGFRYENLAIKTISNEDSVDLNAARLAWIVERRWMRENGHNGIVAGLGLYHFAQADVKVNSLAAKGYRANSGQSFNLGLNYFWSVLRLSLGGESGVSYYRSTGFTDSDGQALLNSSGEDRPLDFFGIYVQFVMGVQF